MKKVAEEQKEDKKERAEDLNEQKPAVDEQPKEKRPQTAEIDSLKEKIKKLEEEKKEQEDKYIRKYADFDNFRKRLLRDKDETVKYANSALLSDLIGVLDDFERAVNSAEESKDFDKLLNGIQLIEKQLSGLLEKKWGLQKFAVPMEPFDPEKHEAFMMEESPDVKKATIAEVFQKGYKLNDRIIRHAKVKVSMPCKKEKKETPDEEPKDE